MLVFTIWHVFLFGFFQLERQNLLASGNLRSAVLKAENAYPGITYDFLLGIARKADLSLDVNESVLRLQGNVSDFDGILFKKKNIILLLLFVWDYYKR